MIHMGKREAAGALLALWCLSAAPSGAAPPKDPPTRCAADAVLVGAACVDKYEASVWRIPDSTGANKVLATRVRQGKATVADLSAGGATQLGIATDDYAPCLDHGEACVGDVFALSLAGVPPSQRATWFQANIACGNSGKRLPSNEEWQAAASGSPDPGGDDGLADCKSGSAPAPVATGSRSACVSAAGAFDMVGNVFEWVADWLPRSTSCGNWAGSVDFQCLEGAAVSGEPGALLRGGAAPHGSLAGPLAVLGDIAVSDSLNDVGFRCAR